MNKLRKMIKIAKIIENDRKLMKIDEMLMKIHGIPWKSDEIWWYFNDIWWKIWKLYEKNLKKLIPQTIVPSTTNQ